MSNARCAHSKSAAPKKRESLVGKTAFYGRALAGVGGFRKKKTCLDFKGESRHPVNEHVFFFLSLSEYIVTVRHI